MSCRERVFLQLLIFVNLNFVTKASYRFSHHSSGGGLKSNASMSALTLLAFLFFLHILQQCIKEHMTEMSTTPVVVMTAGREGEVQLSKSDKIDKTGVSEIDSIKNQIKPEAAEVKVNPFRQDIVSDDTMMRINAAEHKPRNDYEYVYRNTDKTSFPGFVSAMDEK